MHTLGARQADGGGRRAAIELWRRQILGPVELDPIALDGESQEDNVAPDGRVLVPSLFGPRPASSMRLTLSPDGLHVACAAKNGDLITVYDIERESMLLGFRCRLGCKEHRVRSLAWSADSRLLISGGQDSKCKLWKF